MNALEAKMLPEFNHKIILLQCNFCCNLIDNHYVITFNFIIMKQRVAYLLLLLCLVSFARGFAGKDSLEWKVLAREKYTLHYTAADEDLEKRIDNDLQSGLDQIVKNFHH